MRGFFLYGGDMCTRFYMNPDLADLVAPVSKSVTLARRFIIAGNPIRTAGEIKPTDVVPVFAPDQNGQQTIFPMKWGYKNKHKGGNLIVNARSETASVKPTFKEDWERHRCIIPASYYYEWEHYKRTDGKTETGDRYIIQPKGSDITWLCGLYHMDGDFPYFVILTRESSEEIAFIHDRMPLILPRDYILEWIRPDTMPEELLKNAVTEMVAERG